MNSGGSELSTTGSKRKRSSRTTTPQEISSTKPRDLVTKQQEGHEAHGSAESERKFESAEGCDAQYPKSRKPRKISQPDKLEKKERTVLVLPSKPLNAYNLFFRDERSRVIALRDEHQASLHLKVEPNSCESPVASDNAESKTASRGNDGDDHIVNGARGVDTQGTKDKTTNLHEKSLPFFQKLAKHIGLKWKNLPESERAKYKELAADDMRRYRAEMQKYQENLMRETRETAAARVAHYIRMRDEEGDKCSSKMTSGSVDDVHDSNEYTSILFSERLHEKLFDELPKHGLWRFSSDSRHQSLRPDEKEVKSFPATVLSKESTPATIVNGTKDDSLRKGVKPCQKVVPTISEQHFGSRENVPQILRNMESSLDQLQQEQNTAATAFIERLGMPQNDSCHLEQREDHRKFVVHDEHAELIRDMLRSHAMNSISDQIYAEQKRCVPMISIGEQQFLGPNLPDHAPNPHVGFWNRSADIDEPNLDFIEQYGLQRQQLLLGGIQAHHEAFETQAHEAFTNEMLNEDYYQQSSFQNMEASSLQTKNRKYAWDSSWSFPPVAKPPKLWSGFSGTVETDLNLIDVLRQQSLRHEEAQARTQRFNNLSHIRQTMESQPQRNSHSAHDRLDIGQILSRKSWPDTATQAARSRIGDQSPDIAKADQTLLRLPFQTSLFSEIEKHYNERKAKWNIPPSDEKGEKQSEILDPYLTLHSNSILRQSTPADSEPLMSIPAIHHLIWDPSCFATHGRDYQISESDNNNRSLIDSILAKPAISPHPTEPQVTASSAGASRDLLPSEKLAVQQQLHLAQLLHRKMQDSFLRNSS